MEVDFCWPDHHVIVETDGWRFHGTRTAFERDRRRTTRLQLAGWIVVRFTYDDVVRHPGYVVASLWRLLASTVGDIRRA
jgi:very-short-patch-repair endonuclease